MNRLKNYLILNICLVLFLLITVFIKPINTLREYNIRNQMDFSEKVLIYGDNMITQEFTCIEDSDSLELLAVPLGDSIRGEFRVNLYNEADELLGSWITNKYDMKSDGLVQYRLKNDAMNKNQTYRLEISAPELAQDDAVMISLGYDSFKAPGIDSFVIEGSDVDGMLYQDKVLSLSIYKERKNIFAFFACITVFIMANLWLAMKNKNIEFRALPVLILSGFVMLLVLAPGSGPDEDYHYYSSLALSNSIMGRDDPLQFENKYKFDFYMIDDIASCNSNSSFVKTLNGLKCNTINEEGIFKFTDRPISLTWPISHVVPALGMTIGRLMGLNMIWTYTLGRITNMFMYIVLAFLAIRLIPVNKELMLLLAIMPMCMQQCCSLSYDAIVNGLSMLYVAYIFRDVYIGRGLTWKNVSVSVIILIVLAPIKVVYTLLAVLILLLSKDGIKKMLPVVSVPFLVLLVTKWNVFKYLFTVRDAASDSVLYSLGAIVRDPVRFLRMCILTIEQNGWQYLKGMFGSMMTGDFVVIPDYLVLTYMIILLLCVLTERDCIIKSGWQRKLVIGTFLAGAAALLLVFAMSQTLYSSTVVSGMQGRYFIPFFVPLVYCTSGGDGIRTEVSRYKLFVAVWFVELGYVLSLMSQIRMNV